jgi:hypothetical protein
LGVGEDCGGIFGWVEVGGIGGRVVDEKEETGVEALSKRLVS